jgi:dipeptidyl aminopeptidase/acylaminoacyl peptidase
MGGSFGGYAALAGAAFEPDLYKVAIGISGVYNFDRELKSDYRGEGSLKEWLAPMLGDIANDPDVYKDLSPVNFADRIKAKVLLIHGGADSVVHANQSKSMAKALRRADKEVEIDISTWGVHGFYNQKESNRFGSLVGNFLQKHL